jgi:hypothetical protein
MLLYCSSYMSVKVIKKAFPVLERLLNILL